jgi:hypothetical protein
VILTISVLLILTVLLAAFVLAPRLAETRIVWNTTPDRPVGFGYRMAWLAVRTEDAASVIDVLGLEPLQLSNWRSGIGTVYDDELGENHLFVSPPVEGWTFVVGLSLPQPLGRGFADKCTPMLLDLASGFPEAQYYCTYPVIDFCAWARVVDGKLVRAFAIGDEGLVWNKGRLTRHERELGLRLFEMRGVRARKGDAGGPLMLHPTEAHVMHLAGRWSLDPTSLDTAEEPPGLGMLCAPALHWRPELLRHAG